MYSQVLVPPPLGDGCVSLGGDAPGEVWVVEPVVADHAHERARSVEAGDLPGHETKGGKQERIDTVRKREEFVYGMPSIHDDATHATIMRNGAPT